VLLLLLLLCCSPAPPAPRWVRPVPPHAAQLAAWQAEPRQQQQLLQESNDRVQLMMPCIHHINPMSDLQCCFFCVRLFQMKFEKVSTTRAAVK
jgi:hypothetical protein